MIKYEYKVVPAPARGQKAKGVKGKEAQFAHTLAELMNTLGGEGWEYQRAEALPCEERRGLTGRTIETRYLLVFRREIVEPVEHPVLPPIRATEEPASTQVPEFGPARRDDDRGFAAE